LQEEREKGVRGKGFVEHDLLTNEHRFHPVTPSRSLIDLAPIDAAGMSAAELDAALRARVDTAPGGIDERVVRATIWNVPRHIVRELDHVAIREYRKRAMNFHLDTRRPEPIARLRTADGSQTRRATLPELLADRLQERVLPAGIEREPFVKLGLRYLQQAEDAVASSLPVLDG